MESIRATYADALAAQQDGLAALCRSAGWTLSIHHTDKPPETALLALYMSLSGQMAGARA